MRSHNNTWIETERDVPATVIPSGDDVTLNEGTKVMINQEMGDQFTLRTQRGHLVRIEAEDADAIGREPPSGDDEDTDATDEELEGPVEDRVWDKLSEVYDPEIPIDVTELGLIYECNVEENDDGNHDVHVEMTLTAPGCGMGDVMAQDAMQKVESLPDVDACDVEIVFNPPWTPDRMSDEARLELGMI
jgi:probable FeS assembly SUF system protein SufT